MKNNRKKCVVFVQKVKAARIVMLFFELLPYKKISTQKKNSFLLMASFIHNNRRLNTRYE